MILLIDNYDSFTYNLLDYFAQLGEEILLFKNDEIEVSDLSKLNFDKIVISPGPNRPKDSGNLMSIIEATYQNYPILGICLGHQSIAQAFGGKIVRAKEVMHGKTSIICHRDAGVFKGLGARFEATRYHSLVIDQKSLPNCLEVTAWTENEDGTLDEIMGVKHKELNIEGVQFHPESILTEYGHDLLRNFVEA